jgi:hypothetical protein
LIALFAQKIDMKKRLTIVPSDKIVCVDDVCAFIDSDFPWLESNIHAIQWDEIHQTGHIEYTDGTNNRTINSITKYQSAIDLFNATVQQQ